MSHINIHTSARCHARNEERLAAWDEYTNALEDARFKYNPSYDDMRDAYIREATTAEVALQSTYDEIDAKYA